MGPMGLLTCPACRASGESFAASSSTRCGACGAQVYVPARGETGDFAPDSSPTAPRSLSKKQVFDNYRRTKAA